MKTTKSTRRIRGLDGKYLSANSTKSLYEALVTALTHHHEAAQELHGKSYTTSSTYNETIAALALFREKGEAND